TRVVTFECPSPRDRLRSRLHYRCSREWLRTLRGSLKMLESSLRIQNFYWADARFQPQVEADTAGGLAALVAQLRGQFALAFWSAEGKLVLARDPLGSNKLFFTVDES